MYNLLKGNVQHKFISPLKPNWHQKIEQYDMAVSIVNMTWEPGKLMFNIQKFQWP